MDRASGCARPPGYTWTYLRLNEDGSPSAGKFDGWPKTAKELKVLDPCMGSGHFLTFALPILARMRAAEEGLPLSDAIASVLDDNLFGLEIDPRCSQIGAFNLALTAWKLAGTLRTADTESCVFRSWNQREGRGLAEVGRCGRSQAGPHALAVSTIQSRSHARQPY